MASVPYFNEADRTEGLNKEEEKMGQYWRESVVGFEVIYAFLYMLLGGYHGTIVIIGIWLGVNYSNFLRRFIIC